MKLVQHFKVLGKNWRAVMLTKKQYKRKKARANSTAITFCHKRRIDFQPSGFDRETMLHELVHSYMYEMCIYSTQELSSSDLEEVFAELFAKRGEEMLALADKLVLGFQGGMNEGA